MYLKNGIDINNVDTLQFESIWGSSIYCAFIRCLNTAHTSHIINIHFVVVWFECYSDRATLKTL